ncbi:MAG: hypothetical protein HY078_04125 [Elusimicrobia bacterium]|nr:hypothetical protein [Elusimicrobiota bacterium]
MRMPHSGGFILFEVTVSYVVLALALVALVPAFIMAIKANKNAERLQLATDLSQELLEEIRMRKWDEQTSGTTFEYVAVGSTSLGIDTGETASDKTTFDDIDDFNGWTENGVRNPMNVALAPFSMYMRTVTVVYVESTNFTTSGTPTDYKKVEVCTSTSQMTKSVCLDALFTNR